MSQTTFNYKKFNNLVEILEKKGYDIHCFKYDLQCDRGAPDRSPSDCKRGGCNDCHWRQAEFSNTQKLFEICKKECENTYYIQTLDDLDVHSLQSVSCVGITAGASTPNNIIEEVQNNVRNEL